ncbi:MAG TPA: NUDIX hydrolase [Trebonia sp.]|jgi:8-oxo-dGTP pyrophosphatase MutT (NUDIX family)|nr:NUDIX hydrolase [Trebonia sp.]
MGMPEGIDLRCSAVVFRQQAVLLIHRTYGGGDEWVLPGGSPLDGESMAACARREVREETGLLVDPSKVAFVLEVTGPHPGPRTVDIVFAATEHGTKPRPEIREHGMDPCFVPVDQVRGLDLRPPVAGYLPGMLRSGARRYAPYLANLWRPVNGSAQRGRLPGMDYDPDTARGNAEENQT